ncbi:MAG: response regulator [Clostridiales Family XIII bacterium]|jgi:signal transduction histidine kinase|nr:response regulator [Clostridiales Family XIII bacterium]
MPTDNNNQLAEENKRLLRENNKLQRALERKDKLLARNQITLEARQQFNDIVKMERSNLELNMNLLLANIRDYILFFSTAGKIQFCSDSFLRAIGVPSAALVKDRILSDILGDILPAESIEQIRQMARDFVAGTGDNNMEMSLQLDFGRDGNYRDYLVELSILVNDDGGSEGFIMLFYDTTSLTNARREAERANAVKSDFLASISHEIRTPMNAVIGLTSMIEDTSLNARQRDLVTKIKTSSINLLDLINDLLDFSKIEAGKVEILNEYFDLSKLLSEMKALFTLMMAGKSLIFSCEFAADLPQVIYSDGKRLRQIIVNLLNNAYKYTPQGKVFFKVSKGPDETLCIWVTDTGIGIKEDEQYKLFKEFSQLDQVRNKHITGTGLGLAITKKLCELMGGSIYVQSVYGEGSTFSVILPLQAGTINDLEHNDADIPQFTARNARVLIVDDVEINLEITRYMLEFLEVQTEVALNGQEAIHLIEKEHFDLVLMDHMMPIMDGIEATRVIRKEERERAENNPDNPEPATHLPIVALTANAISGVEEMFRKEGFDGFISKPIDRNNLVWALYELLPSDLIEQ